MNSVCFLTVIDFRVLKRDAIDRKNDRRSVKLGAVYEIF